MTGPSNLTRDPCEAVLWPLGQGETGRLRTVDLWVEGVRVAEDRFPTPSAGALDSQSVPSAVMVSHSVGYDGGKNIKGRKRFTLVDPLGLLIAVKVVAANVPEQEGAQQRLQTVQNERQRLPRLGLIWVDTLGIPDDCAQPSQTSHYHH